MAPTSSISHTLLSVTGEWRGGEGERKGEGREEERSEGGCVRRKIVFELTFLGESLFTDVSQSSQ